MTDVHVGGDVHQIILGGIAPIPGLTVLEKRDYLRDHADELRQVVLGEPRGGHPSLFADLAIPPVDPRAAAAFIIMEFLGYPLFSGSNTMATAIALIEEGVLQAPAGKSSLVLESPGGLVNVEVDVEPDGKVSSVTFKPDDTACVIKKGALVEVDGRGRVRYDLVWAGCWYAVVAAEDCGLAMMRNEEAAQGQLAFEIMEALAREPNPVHPVLGEQGRIALVLFAAAPYRGSDGRLRRRISPVVHPRSVSRCPAGTGTTAAVAQLVADGAMALDEDITTISCWDTQFEASCCENPDDYGVRVAVTGHGWVIARKELILDATDPLTPTGALRALLDH
nr:proline racemase family protein [Mangrovicella endophytica]